MFCEAVAGEAFPRWTRGGTEGRGPVHDLAGAGSPCFILM